MVEELLHLTDDEEGMLSQDAYPDLSATYPVFTELYRYQVPVDKKLVFRPGHTFSLLARKLAAQAVGGAVSDDGGVFTIQVVQANEATVNDMTLSPAVPVVNDAYYFGYAYPFSGIRVKYSTAAKAGHAHAVEYWNGAAWVAVGGLVDATSAFTAVAGTYNIIWRMPLDWKAVTVAGTMLFWIRCRVTTIPATPTGATGDQAWINPSPTAIDDTDKIKVEVRDQNELVRMPLIADAQYRQVSEFTDRDLVYRLDIAKEILAGSGKWVIISAKAKSPIKVSECYFDLTCDRERLAII